jgi:sugar lactone lactonase YvrE
MKILTPLLVFAALLASGALRAADVVLEEVASFPTQQVTGVTVSASGRLFVNFPNWSDDHTTSVAEVMPDGKVRPYPDANWNAKEGPPEKRWVCVQSVVADGETLWVLDPAAPKTESIVKGGPKLVQIDLKTDQPIRTIGLDESIAPERSYLNDVRIDRDDGHAFITESGLGAIIVVDLKTSKARRLLASHPATKFEKSEGIEVDGIKVIDPKTGEAPAFNVDGIALDREDGWLYFHALRGTTLYRIRTNDLIDESLSDEQLGGKIENLGRTPKPDGMLEGRNGTVYLTAIEKDGIARFDATTRKTTMLIEDKRLQWPDTMAWGPAGTLYVTTSQIHRMPKYHDGKSLQEGPFRVFRMKLP